MPAFDDLQPGARTFTFADAAGSLYRVVYGRDAIGRPTWRFYQPDGHGVEHIDLSDGPEVPEAELASHALGFAHIHIALGWDGAITRSPQERAEAGRRLREAVITQVA